MPLEVDIFKLLRDPVLKFFEINRWEFGQVWPESRCLSKIDMLDVGLDFVGIPVQQDSDAPWQSPRDMDFVSTDQGHIEPAELSGCHGREFGIEIAGQGEDRTGDVFTLDVVESYHQCE